MSLPSFLFLSETHEHAELQSPLRAVSGHRQETLGQLFSAIRLRQHLESDTVI